MCTLGREPTGNFNRPEQPDVHEPPRPALEPPSSTTNRSCAVRRRRKEAWQWPVVSLPMWEFPMNKSVPGLLVAMALAASTIACSGGNGGTGVGGGGGSGGGAAAAGGGTAGGAGGGAGGGSGGGVGGGLGGGGAGGGGGTNGYGLDAGLVLTGGACASGGDCAGNDSGYLPHCTSTWPSRLLPDACTTKADCPGSSVVCFNGKACAAGCPAPDGGQSTCRTGYLCATEPYVGGLLGGCVPDCRVVASICSGSVTCRSDGYCR